jgi:hypothetical protein
MRITLTSLLLLLGSAAVAAPTKQTVNNICTAAPGVVNLTGTSATAGSGPCLSAQDHNHSISGILPQGNGGTGAGALTCTNQFLTSNGTLYSCSTDVLASAQHVNQGTTTTLLHGNAAGNPSWTNVVSADFGAGLLDEAHGGTGAGALTCTNQFLTSNGTLYSCSTDVLASAQHVNQGTTVTLLHGNAAGNPSWTNVVSADFGAGLLDEAHGGTGVGTLTCTNQFLTSNGTVYSCSTDVLASAQHANQGSTSTILHGNAAGNPSWANVTGTDFGAGQLDEAHGGTGAGALTCTNQFTTSNGTSYSCATATLAGPQFANQGTTSSVLIGNAAGNPSWATSVPAAAENVQHDSTLTGNGSTGSNLGIALGNANTWTAMQTFSVATSNATAAAFTGNGTGNGANFFGGASGASGTGANAYGINVTGGSASGAGVPGPGINVNGGTGAGLGAPAIVATGGASAGTNVAGTYGIFVTGGAATGNAAATTGGLGGDGANTTGGVGGATATGTGGQGGYGLRSTGAVGGSASGVGGGGQGGFGALVVGGAGGAAASGTGGTGGTALSFNGGAGVTANGSGGDGLSGQNGLGTGTGTNGDAATFFAQASGGTGTARGYALRLTQSGTIKGTLLKVPITADPSSFDNGAEWISGATTAMTSKVRLNGVTQPYLTYGANGSRAVQTLRVAGCATAAALNASCNTTVTWPVAFPDANYTVVCSGDLITSAIPILQGVNAKVAASVTAQTLANSAAAAQFTTIDCTAIHD